MVKAARPLCLALTTLTLATAAAAAPVPAGAKFRLSSCVGCASEKPAVAGAPSGSFLAAWDGSSPLDLQGVTARLFGANGAPLGNDFAVDSNKLPPQSDAAIASDALGNYIVAWSAVLSGSSEILAQRFTAAGKTNGKVIRVNVDPVPPAIAPDDFKPAVTFTPDGGFVVVWISLVPPSLVANSVPLVLARRFNPAGLPTGPQVQLNTGLVSGDRPSVCSDGAGRYIAAWPAVDGYHPFEPSKFGISARRVSPAGVFMGGEMIVAPPLAVDSSVSISCGKRNTFAIVWDSDQAPAPPLGGILVQRFTRAGRPNGTPALAAGGQRLMRNPSVTYDPNGNFIVAWQGDDSEKSGIFFRRFNAAGVPLEDQVTIHSVDLGMPRPVGPEVTHVGATGGLVVVWGGSSGLYGRRYTITP